MNEVRRCAEFWNVTLLSCKDPVKTWAQRLEFHKMRLHDISRDHLHEYWLAKPLVF